MLRSKGVGIDAIPIVLRSGKLSRQTGAIRRVELAPQAEFGDVIAVRLSLTQARFEACGAQIVAPDQTVGIQIDITDRHTAHIGTKTGDFVQTVERFEVDVPQRVIRYGIVKAGAASLDAETDGTSVIVFQRDVKGGRVQFAGNIRRGQLRKTNGAATRNLCGGKSWGGNNSGRSQEEFIWLDLLIITLRVMSRKDPRMTLALL
jgi:hypothetical protein